MPTGSSHSTCWEVLRLSMFSSRLGAVNSPRALGEYQPGLGLMAFSIPVQYCKCFTHSYRSAIIGCLRPTVVPLAADNLRCCGAVLWAVQCEGRVGVEAIRKLHNSSNLTSYINALLTRFPFIHLNFISYLSYFASCLPPTSSTLLPRIHAMTTQRQSQL